MHKDERGFSLIEILAVIALSAILLTLGAGALRHYWLVHTLDAATDEVVTQLRQVQERTVSESHPLVFGVRFRDGSSQWDVVKYDPAGSGSCTREQQNTFDNGVLSAGVQVIGPRFPMDPTRPELVSCKAQSWAASTDEFVFFYARGNAVEGDLTLRQPALGPTRDETVDVFGITGRVVRS